MIFDLYHAALISRFICVLLLLPNTFKLMKQHSLEKTKNIYCSYRDEVINDLLSWCMLVPLLFMM